MLPLREANEIMSQFTRENWPEDEWFSIGENWELNLWINEDFDGPESHTATLYPVENGRICTSDFQRIAVCYKED